MRSCLTAAVVAALSTASLAHDRPYDLMVGDPAPPIEVASYYPRGPVPRIEPGKPYVVEFWATWCIPCINGIPHLTKLQEQYKDKAAIMGVAVWEPDPAKTDRYIQAQGDRMRYLVAIDSVPPAPAGNTNAKMWAFENGKMSLSWLKASGSDGIPDAFIVDATGRIAWIGEPSQMDGPLADVVEGRWDLAAATEKHRQKMTIQAKSKPLAERLEKARETKDVPAALAAADELLALGAVRFAGEKFDILLNDAKEPDKANTWAREAIAGIARNDKSALNTIAYAILEQPEGPGRDLGVALAAAERSVTITEGKHSRTVKMLAEVYAARGDYAKAVEVQRRAVAVAYPEEKPEFAQLLAKYEKKETGR